LSTTNNTPVEHPGRGPGSTGQANYTNGIPEILVYAELVDLPGGDREKVVELKLAGNRDEELYRMLLIAQCNALHKAIPFLFEWIGDATELLLPEILLHSDSLIRRMVNEIPEEDWQEIEIIGWLYQFYISEKKDEVIGKVVKSEDIPAATQLFTPNWIVKYMVQNSLGAQWLATYPHSPLKGQMEYYIEPAEQTEEVKVQLAAITPSTLNPEDLTLIDPADGSGHILVEGYELFKAIYLECGYRLRDVPQLILEKNLFGLDIDERAAQLTGFALMMKGRADDRRLFERGVKLNVMALVDSAGFDAEGLAKGVDLSAYGLKPGDLTELKRLFEHATTFGSLIQVPEGLAAKLPALKQLSETTSQDLFVSEALKSLGPLAQQAVFLATKYDAVVLNPPYMGGKNMNTRLKSWAVEQYPLGKSDSYSIFIQRSEALANEGGRFALITMQGWMFLSSYSELRNDLIEKNLLLQMFHTGPGVFPELGAYNVLTTAFVFARMKAIDQFKTRFVKANEDPSVPRKIDTLKAVQEHHQVGIEALKVIPGFPFIYWLDQTGLANFERFPLLGDMCAPKQGMATGDNGAFVRLWHEIDLAKFNIACRSEAEAARSGSMWFPYNKGGKYRKWYGNNDCVVNWQNEGAEIRKFGTANGGKARSAVRNPSYYFRPGIVYSLFGFENFGVRYKGNGFVFDVSGASLFPDKDIEIVLGFLCSNVAFYYLNALAPTVNFQVGDLARLPLPQFDDEEERAEVIRLSKTNIELCRNDWDSRETSWDFQRIHIVEQRNMTLQEASHVTQSSALERRQSLINNEVRLNQALIALYGLREAVLPDVLDRDVSITIEDIAEQMCNMVSYAIGCMMGRYSLDAPGLIYAHSGNEGFDPNKYATFPADADGIVPLTDIEWFEDDAAHRLIEFISVAWDKGHLEDNLTFLADNHSPKKNESSRETLRRYLCDCFFKDHLQTYKKRPIYWLFSSGKLRAFQCLVYLHRYNEGTLSRMRTEYVNPLQGKFSARNEQLSGDINAATSTAHRKKLEREKDKLAKQQVELQTFDEKLRHYADQRISLDLDDGVKVNYGKFGDLLAEVKAITGKK